MRICSGSWSSIEHKTSSMNLSAATSWSTTTGSIRALGAMAGMSQVKMQQSVSVNPASLNGQCQMSQQAATPATKQSWNQQFSPTACQPHNDQSKNIHSVTTGVCLNMSMLVKSNQRENTRAYKHASQTNKNTRTNDNYQAWVQKYHNKKNQPWQSNIQSQACFRFKAAMVTVL